MLECCPGGGGGIGGSIVGFVGGVDVGGGGGNIKILAAIILSSILIFESHMHALPFAVHTSQNDSSQNGHAFPLSIVLLHNEPSHKTVVLVSRSVISSSAFGSSFGSINFVGSGGGAADEWYDGGGPGGGGGVDDLSRFIVGGGCAREEGFII